VQDTGQVQYIADFNDESSDDGDIEDVPIVEYEHEPVASTSRSRRRVKQ
jgi:hypothetical protein